MSRKKRSKKGQNARLDSSSGSKSAGVKQETRPKEVSQIDRDGEKGPPMKTIRALASKIKEIVTKPKCLEFAAIAVALAVLIVYICQLRVMQQQVKLAERAWIGYVLPASFPLEGPATPATLQVTNFGKTPARQVEGDIIATALMKGEEPTFDFTVGHPHNRFYAGAVFPNSPFPVTISVVRYGADKPAVISPEDLRKGLESGQYFIIFYGRITYTDIFGIKRWTNFCTGSGTAMQGEPDTLKKCIRYNDVDSE